MSTRVLSLALVLSATLPAHAGCLATPTIDVVYNSAPLVFRARVLQITPVPSPPPPPPGLGSSGTDAPPMDHLRLQVLEVFKGDPGTEITVLGGDPLFGKGGEFLVFVSPYQQQLVVNACSRTGLVASPRAVADLALAPRSPRRPIRLRAFSISCPASSPTQKSHSLTLTESRPYPIH